MNWEKLYRLIKRLFIPFKNFIKCNLISIIKGIATSVITVFLAILAIPLANNLIYKYIDPYTVSLLDLDKKIFIFIDWSIIILAFLTLSIAIYKLKDKKLWHFPALPFNILLFFGIIW